jgi:predicted acyl esterase
MRDGDSLQADVYIPTGVDSAEVILIQTPYNKNLFSNSLPLGIGLNLDAQPYIWVIVDWRGFYGSNMADLSNFTRGEDGYDICDWITNQIWHKDRIGTWGPSALGAVQYMTIAENHPNHTCAVPQVATGHQAYEAYFYGGVLEEARLTQLDALGYGLSPLVMANVYDNTTWQFASLGTWYPSSIQIPTLQIGGWYDHNIDEMMDFYKDSRNLAAVSVQDEQWLLVGPWVHGGTGAAYIGSSIQGELTYPTAQFKSDSMAWDFFNYYLLDAANNWPATDFITYFDMGGSNAWLTSNADDIEATGINSLYLNYNEELISGGGAGNTTFISDPSNPSPTIGGATLGAGLNQGPYDQNSLDARQDILTFTSAELNSNVSTTGRITVDLYISSDQADADIAIRLTDVYPDGRSMLITDGIKRMRFRNNDYTAAGEVFMTPGQVYPVTIELPFTNYTWKTGHKIKIYVSGNHSTRFNVNLQNGGTMYQAGTGNVANITVHHDATYPSKINLPGTNPSLGIESIHHQLTVYPNPVSDQLFINSGEGFFGYEIYELSGRLLKTGTLNSSMIEVEELNQGVYILKLTGQEVPNQIVKFSKD